MVGLNHTGLETSRQQPDLWLLREICVHGLLRLLHNSCSKLKTGYWRHTPKISNAILGCLFYFFNHNTFQTTNHYMGSIQQLHLLLHRQSKCNCDLQTLAHQIVYQSTVSNYISKRVSYCSQQKVLLCPSNRWGEHLYHEPRNCAPIQCVHSKPTPLTPRVQAWFLWPHGFIRWEFTFQCFMRTDSWLQRTITGILGCWFSSCQS